MYQATLGQLSHEKLLDLLEKHGAGYWRRRGVDLRWILQSEAFLSPDQALGQRKTLFREELGAQINRLRYGAENLPEMMQAAGKPLPAPTGTPVELEWADSLERWLQRNVEGTERLEAELKRQTEAIKNNQNTHPAAQAQLGVGGEK